MAVNLVTGRKGDMHITSDDDRMRNAEAFGTGKFMMENGNRLAATVNGNVVTIADGMCMSYGTQMGIEPYDSVTLTVDSIALGYQRHDLVVMRYTRDVSSDTENAELVIVKGNAVQQNPTDPSITDGNILNGAILDETAIWRLVVTNSGITVEPLLKRRNGTWNSDPRTVDPSEDVPSADNPFIINAAAIDRIWGSGLEDGDGEVY